MCNVQFLSYDNHFTNVINILFFFVLIANDEEHIASILQFSSVIAFCLSVDLGFNPSR